MLYPHNVLQLGYSTGNAALVSCVHECVTPSHCEHHTSNVLCTFSSNLADIFMERQINIYSNIYTFLQIFGPRYKSFIPIFKSFVPSFKSFITRYKWFEDRYKWFVSRFKWFIPIFKYDYLYLGTNHLFVPIFKYGWHGNIHYFNVDGGELNLGTNDLYLGTNHLWICSICT